MSKSKVEVEPISASSDSRSGKNGAKLGSSSTDASPSRSRKSGVVRYRSAWLSGSVPASSISPRLTSVRTTPSTLTPADGSDAGPWDRLAVRHHCQRLQRGLGQSCLLAVEHETLHDRGMLGTRVVPPSPGDLAELEATTITVVPGDQVEERLADLASRSLDHLGQGHVSHRLVDDHQDRLQGSAQLCASHLGDQWAGRLLWIDVLGRGRARGWAEVDDVIRHWFSVGHAVSPSMGGIVTVPSNSSTSPTPVSSSTSPTHQQFAERGDLLEGH